MTLLQSSSDHHHFLMNMTNANWPRFPLKQLGYQTNYILQVFAHNTKGVSASFEIVLYSHVSSFLKGKTFHFKNLTVI